MSIRWIMQEKQLGKIKEKVKKNLPLINFSYETRILAKFLLKFGYLLKKLNKIFKRVYIYWISLKKIQL